MPEPTDPAEPDEPAPRGSWPGIGPLGEPPTESPTMPPLLGSAPAGPPRFPEVPPERWPALVPPPPPPNPPTVPGPPPSGGGNRQWVPVVAVAVLIVLVASLLVALTRDDDKPETATSSDPATESSETTESTEPTESTESSTDEPSSSSESESESSSESESDDFDAIIDEIKRFVERERGLTFIEDFKVELAGEGEFQDMLLEDFEEDVSALKEQEEVLTGLDLIDPDEDVEARFRELLEIGVVGFYDQKTGQLVVRGTDTGPYVRQVIAHELVHALDDQHFELDRPEYENPDDESGLGFTALVEGTARRIEDRYAESLSEAEKLESFEEQLEMQAEFIDELLSIPEILISLIQMPYEEGPNLIDALLEAGGQSRLDEAYGAPPTSSEQVLDPDRYLEGEGPVAVAFPAADGTLSNQGVLGEYLIEQTLGEGVEGWGGDAYVTWTDGAGLTCLRDTVVGDTAADTDELSAAFQEWASEHGATVEAVPGESVTITACR